MLDDDEKSSEEDIVYTDQSSLLSNMDDLSLDDDPNRLLQDMRRDSDVPSIDISFEVRQRRNQAKEAKLKR